MTQPNEPGVESEIAVVPVVAYVNGKREVIGEAAVRGEDVKIAFNSTEIANWIMGRLMGTVLPHLSIGHFHHDATD